MYHPAQYINAKGADEEQTTVRNDLSLYLQTVSHGIQIEMGSNENGSFR